MSERTRMRSRERSSYSIDCSDLHKFSSELDACCESFSELDSLPAAPLADAFGVALRRRVRRSEPSADSNLKDLNGSHRNRTGLHCTVH